MSTPITTMSNTLINVPAKYHGPGYYSGDSNQFPIGQVVQDQITGGYQTPKSDPSHDSAQMNQGQKLRPGESHELNNEGFNYNKNNESNLEIRHFSIKDGTLCAKVYSSKGKLLREIPPGYIPFGEYGLDVKI